MADGDLPAIGEAGFGARNGLPIDDGDFVTVLTKEPGGSNAEQAGAKDDNAHVNSD